jgi:hypothetical protein
MMAAIYCSSADVNDLAGWAERLKLAGLCLMRTLDRAPRPFKRHKSVEMVRTRPLFGFSGSRSDRSDLAVAAV